MATRKELIAQREQREAIAIKFLTELGRGIPNDQRVMIGMAEEASTERGSDGKVINSGWYPEPWKPDDGVNVNVNFYAVISSSIKTWSDKRQRMRYWRGEPSFGRGLALMVDDIALNVEARGSGAKGTLTVADLVAILPPTTVVETSPGNTQAMYFMREPVANMRRFKAFLVCFVNSVLAGAGGDSTVKDVARYVRVPVGINNKRHGPSHEKAGQLKYPDEAGKPWRVRLVSADYSRRYTMEEVADAFGFQIIEPVFREANRMDVGEMTCEFVHLAIAAALLNRAKMGEGSGGAVILNGSGKYRIICPWADEHTDGRREGAYFRGPVPGAERDFVFGCGHDTCRKAGRKWKAFIEKIVEPWIWDELASANYEAASGDWPLEAMTEAT